MNTKDLQYFLAVTELGHFGRAAEKCGVSQPTLSAQIKKLESALGIKLFERTSRRVNLTDSGRHIAISARRIMREIETINATADSAQDALAGRLRLGAIPTISTYIFPGLLPRVRRTLPKLRLTLEEERTAGLINKLLRGELDAALLSLPVADDSLISHSLFDDEFMLAVPKGHELGKQERIDPRDLTQFTLMLLEDGHCLRDQALEVCHTHGIGEDQDFRATGMETLRRMVKAGSGITIIPKMAVNSAEDDIKYLRFQDPVPVRTIGLVWRKTSTRREAIKALAELFN